MSSVLQPTEMASVGGLDPLIQIINRSDRATERLIVEGLQERDPELAEEVKSRMFMFEDITLLEDRDVQQVLRQVDNADLAVALKGVTDEVRIKVTSNMFERAATTLLEDVDLLGPVLLRQVEEAQQKVILIIRRLEDAGEIVLRRAPMTSTSSEAVVVRGDLGHAAPLSVGHPDLRAGTWTRLGASTVLGDSATEATSARWPTGPAGPAPRRATPPAGPRAADVRRRRADRAAEAQAAATERARTDVLATQQSLVDALTAAVERCDADLATRQAELADAAVSLGLGIAEAVLQREVATMVDPGAEAPAAPSPRCRPPSPSTVRMHPRRPGRARPPCSRGGP